VIACAASAAPAHAQPAGDPPASAPATTPEQSPADAPAAEAEKSTVELVLESTRSSVRSSTEWLARSVDSAFGSKPFEQGGKVYGNVTLGWVRREGEGAETDLRFNARLRLPNLEQRVHVFIGNEDRRDVETGRPDALSRNESLPTAGATERAFFAGLLFAFLDSFDFRLGVHSDLKPFAQANYSRLWQTGRVDTVDFRQTLFWTVDDNFGSTTSVSYQHDFSARVAARWLSSATITRKTRKFEWTSRPGTYHSFGAQRVLAFEAPVSGVEGSGVAVSEYGLLARWEQPVHDNWLLADVSVGHAWVRSSPITERTGVWGVGLALKMKF